MEDDSISSEDNVVKADSKAKKVFRHLLKYGGAYLLILFLYLIFGWVQPLVMTGSFLVVLGVHLFIGIIVWAHHGIENMD